MEIINFDDLMLKLKSDFRKHSYGSIDVSNGISNIAFGKHLENVLRDEYYSRLLKLLIADFEEQVKNSVSEVIKLQVTLDLHVSQAFSHITNQSLMCNVTSEMMYLLSKLERDAKCSFYQSYKNYKISY